MINEAAFQSFVYPGRGFCSGCRKDMSPQQVVIYNLLEQGMDIDQIGEELNITRQAVHAHIQTMKAKGWPVSAV